MQHKNILKHMSKVTGSTFLSRILGYIRDMAIANYFGAGAVADAFYVAYRIPNLLRRLLGEGSLIAAFVPVYTEYLHHKSEEERKRFLSTISTVLFVLLVAITILGIILAPKIVALIAPGFSASPEKFKLAVILTRIMFPFFIAIGMAAFFMGILNAHNLFIYPALAPCFLSISELMFLFFICPFLDQPIRGLAYGVVCGGLLQALFQLVPIIRMGVHVRPMIDLTNEGFRRVFLLMLPAVIAVSVDQINAFVDVICASWLPEGSVTSLYYANHLMLFPLALFGIAVATVSLPSLSKAAAYNNMDDLKITLARSLKVMVFFIIPSSIGLILLAHPIIRLLFERGKFDARATMMTAQALIFYSTGIIAYASVKILSTAFYSLKDTRTPVKIAAIAMLLNVELNFILMGPLGVGGLALATAFSSVFNAFGLFYMLRKKIGRLGLQSLFSTFIKVCIAGIVMAGACYFAYGLVSESKILSVFFPITTGVLVYAAVTYILKIEEARHIFEEIKKIILLILKSFQLLV